MYHTTHPMKSVAKSWTMMMPSPMQHIPLPSSLMNNISTHNSILCCDFNYVNLSNQRGTRLLCSARRQIRYQDDGDDKDSDEEYGHNEEIAKLESYSQSAKGEVLLVHALVDQEEVDVLIFKKDVSQQKFDCNTFQGFSSCLSYSTSPDPTRSILPARAVIVSIDRIKGPFNPANIEYLQKGVTWEEFKTNLLSN
ncbi:hypothetical protein GLYMA_02G085800v4 [Glycine max]|uniref:DUF7734 domain-containing protein n=1 Tax=Glycine soja TaxID=3848 RepID=A0A445LLL4_GLYSO|nr:uncharacterized protein LOC100810515 isoform X1 [Glycine max]XP_028200136.1 uncharacterized protein LOC114384625 isoform X1 [Glycine soja]KAG4401897.1 hypothetical protein GLYMA_02G085800v4 [Glycine max]KAG5079481.1 hypothetical protein JHK86_003546 [Glycine max]KAH1059377.1 hypothetical protein GYH30_003423 [Glycine max]KAH1260682.1 hypothetical protein GmHk_02G003751 [Glycine max]RZC24007.1 hypothetical protein D0Y65_003355 [Glycine soja]|eukprot:XP_014621347.1 uncharacterized protein LOC100810515 isoform X1 [Glycine max]